MATRMQQRRGTAEQWTLANPTLAPAEIGFETDTNQFKIGDGVNQWEDLEYFLNSGEVDEILGDYVPLSEKGEANGVATLDVDGQVPAAQLANATVDLSDYATETYVDTAVTNLVASAPEALDTLNELAAALGDDASFATTVTNSIATKQDKVEGVSDTEIGYLDGVTSAIQTQINSKQATLTGAATTIASDNLTVSRALASDGSGKVAVSSVTATELGHLSGVTSAIQTQINGKANTSHTHNQSELITTVSNKSAGYTILAADKNSIIRSTGSAITITIANVLAIGERIDFVQSGAGQITFAASGVTLQSRDNKLKTAAQHAGATVMCVASGVYVLIGDLAA